MLVLSTDPLLGPPAPGIGLYDTTWIAVKAAGINIPLSCVVVAGLRFLNLASRENGDDSTNPNDESAQTSGTDERPRLSKKAILGVILIPVSLLSLSLAIFAVAAPAASTLTTTVGLPGIIIPFLTTVLGIAAINDILHSNGRICGLVLAFISVVYFVLLIINGAMLGLFLYFYYSGMEMEFAMSLFLAVGQTALLGGWLSSDIVKRLWNVVSPSEKGEGAAD